MALVRAHSASLLLFVPGIHRALVLAPARRNKPRELVQEPSAQSGGYNADADVLRTDMERPVKVPPSGGCTFGVTLSGSTSGGRKRARLGSLSTVIQSDIRGSAEAAAQSFIRPDLTLTNIADQEVPAA